MTEESSPSVSSMDEVVENSLLMVTPSGLRLSLGGYNVMDILYREEEVKDLVCP